MDVDDVLRGAAEWKLGRAPAPGTAGHAEAEARGLPAAGHWYKPLPGGGATRLNWSWSKGSNVVLPSWDHPLPDVPGSLDGGDAWLTKGCALKLYFQLAGVETESHPAATFGKIGHTIVERHLLHEKPGRLERRTAGERGPDGFWPSVPFEFKDREEVLTATSEHLMVARTGSAELEPYREAVREGRGFVEEPVRIAYAFPGPVLKDANGVDRTPYLDVKGFADVYVTHTTQDGVEAPGIADHKFRSSLDFAPTALQLRFDGQQLTYAFVLSLFHESSPWRGDGENPPGVYVEHLNFLKPGTARWHSPVAKCVPVRSFAPWKDIEKNWTDRVEVSAARLHTLVQLASKGTPLEQVPHNTGECSAYGGCPYGGGGRNRPGMNLCPRAPGAAARLPTARPRRFTGTNKEAVRAATQEKNKMSLAAALAAARKRKQGDAPPPPAPPVPEPVVEVAPPAPEPVVEEKPRVRRYITPYPDTIVPPDAAPMDVTTGSMIEEVAETMSKTSSAVKDWSVFVFAAKQASLDPTPENADLVASAGGFEIARADSHADPEAGGWVTRLRELDVPPSAFRAASDLPNEAEQGEALSLLEAVFTAVRAVDAEPAGHGRPALAVNLAREAAKSGTNGVVGTYTTSRLKKLISRHGDHTGFNRKDEPVYAKADGPLGEWLVWDEELSGVRPRTAAPVEVAPVEVTPVEAPTVEAPTVEADDAVAALEARVAVLEKKLSAIVGILSA